MLSLSVLNIIIPDDAICSQRKRILIVSLGEKGTRDLNVYKTSSATTTTTFSNNTENPFLKKITVILKKRFGISRTIL